MKIAVLSINIGDYVVFWKEFYESAKKNFMTDAELSFYVFTDNISKIEDESGNDVYCIYQEDMGWPFNTMKRFHLFAKITNQLLEYDYVFFANANAKFVSKIDTKLIDTSKLYIMAEHPGFHGKRNEDKPFERNTKSNAYVSLDNGKFYVQGAFYGGKSKEFVDMIRFLDDETEKDLSKNIIAIWHDESFLNMFVSKNLDKCQILGWQYLYYEERVFPYRPVILLRDKRKYITNKNGRFKNQNYKVEYFKLFLRNIKWKFLILLHIKKLEENIVQDNQYRNNNVTYKAGE